jgi:hypothetical protein
MTMPYILRGLVAGFVATFVLSMLMFVKQMMGVMPELNPIAMIVSMLGVTSVSVGWVMHFMIGTVMWGILFSLLRSRIPSGDTLSGIWFGVGAWVLMMVVVMPMAGAGLFGLNIGVMAPVMTLMLHIIFGAVLGAVYGKLGGHCTP